MCLFFNALQPDTGRISLIADNPDSSARGNPEGTESYEQAQKCGMHFTFHCFPCFGHIFPYTIINNRFPLCHDLWSSA